MTVPAAAAARATATSPSGCTACTPVGEISTGRLTSRPMTVVASWRSAGRPATCGRKRSSENARTLSCMVTPASVPATTARYTDRGSCRLARRCASATVSNQSLVLAISGSPDLAAAGRRPGPARATGLLGKGIVGEAGGERAEGGIEVHGEVGVGVHDPPVIAGPAGREGGPAHGQRVQRVGRLPGAARHEIADGALPRVV